MNDAFTASDDANSTGPIPAVPDPADAVVTFEPVEPDPEATTVLPVPDVPAPGAPELEQATPAPVPAPAPRAVLVADAKARSWRTLLQGLVTAILASVGLVVATYLKNGDVTSVDWKALGMAVLMAAGTAGASYLHKMLGE